MREPPVKKILYWCDHCNVPLIGKNCACGSEGRKISLLQPYDVRPALAADTALIKNLVHKRFGDVPLNRIMLLNKTGGVDRADLVIMNGERFGWLTFDPVTRTFNLDIAPEALPYLIAHVKQGIVDLDTQTDARKEQGRIGGKKLSLKTPVPDGTVIVKYRNKYGTGMVRGGHIKVKEIIPVEQKTPSDPDWGVAVQQNRYHLKNLERNAVRTIRHHLHDRPTINVSFSGGKDSTAVLHLARKAGVTKAFFIDTGIEFPETVEFVKSQGVEIIPPAGDFWQAAEKAGPPGKDHRWCCKLLKLRPLKLYLATAGPCVTVQGNRWYESWNRADLEETSQNPDNPLQMNISPIRNWRALEVFLYLWWQKLPLNPLYEKGIERIGCYLCPSMLESEYEELKNLNPDAVRRWSEALERWATKKGLPEEYCTWGLWRWKALPPKMRELCNAKGIALNEDYSVKPVVEGKTKHPVDTQKVDRKKGETTMIPQAKHTAGTFDVEKIRGDFPILTDIIYLDNAATSFSPEPVVQAIVDFEHQYRANIGRGIHRLTRIASQRYWHAHEKVAQFIGGNAGVTVFTKNTTEAINMVAQGLSWNHNDRVITTILEHHSNLLPWRNLNEHGVGVDVIGITADYFLDLFALEQSISDATRLVAVTHASNVLGVISPIEKIAEICHDHGALLLVDGAQTVPHMPMNVNQLGCDFFAFSGHKMLGPTGTGVLWMKEELIKPMMLGGGMVETVTKDGYTTAEGYQKYEAGTPNIGGGIGLGVAVDYLAGIGMEEIRRHEDLLTTRLIEGLKKIDRVRVYAPRRRESRIGVVSFTIDGIHPHEVAQQLDESADIMVRSGHHCCQPLMEHLGLPDGTVRASLALYNTGQEIDLLIAAVEEIVRGL
ncbi:MAG: aminotransferase class V-fold PLP-dependent enzyme [Methanoregula sp.]|nr:aminotransferase class V-fold PLP-dependent enzyme [Methanoregula sp.]